VTEPPAHTDGGADGRGGSAPRPAYTERLWAPIWLWLVASVVAATLGLAFGLPLGPVAGIVAWVLPEAMIVWVLVTSAATVAVGPDGLQAGRARLPWSAMGAVGALDTVAATALRGRDADARAYLLLRPWVQPAVRVNVDDPRDPAPYWYVSTRWPAALAAAIEQARAGSGAIGDGDRPDEAG
jgi:hypothetical protein